MPANKIKTSNNPKIANDLYTGTYIDDVNGLTSVITQKPDSNYIIKVNGANLDAEYLLPHSNKIYIHAWDLHELKIGNNIALNNQNDVVVNTMRKV